MHLNQKCAHLLWSYPAHDIPNRTDFVSRFESKPFLKNILESNAGGRGYPQRNGASQRLNLRALPLALSGMRYIQPNQLRIEVRIKPF
jgi:hypothetical protein